MKRILISISILSFLVVPQITFGSEEDDLMAANEKLSQAWRSLDAETAASLISEGAVGYNPDSAFPFVGPMESTQAERTEYMKTVFQNIEIALMNPYNIQSRVFGNTGIVWGHITFSVKHKEDPRRNWYLRYTSTWRKIEGKWLIVMVHYSTIPSGRWAPWYEQFFNEVE